MRRAVVSMGCHRRRAQPSGSNAYTSCRCHRGTDRCGLSSRVDEAALIQSYRGAAAKTRGGNVHGCEFLSLRGERFAWADGDAYSVFLAPLRAFRLESLCADCLQPACAHGYNRVHFQSPASRVNKNRSCSRSAPCTQNSIRSACRQKPHQCSGRGTSPGCSWANLLKLASRSSRLASGRLCCETAAPI